MWQLTESPMYLGYLGMAQGLPLLVFQLVGGVLADRVNRLRLLIVTQALTSITLTRPGVSIRSRSSERMLC